MNWRRARLFLIGLALVLGGATLAWRVQTAGGIAVQDLRFAASDGRTLGALLYLPPPATPERRAPAVLLVHTYLASREAQSGLSIELARRGYVVLAIDQPGHGYSDPPAVTIGLGGPDGLRFLRSLAMVDPARIGLAGNGLGGAAVLWAADAWPDQYQAMVLDGSAPGAAGTPEGTPTFPRNLALIYSRYDTFSRPLWGIEYATDIGRSEKLAKLFGLHKGAAIGQVYGDPTTGLARVLFSPAILNAAAPISPQAIANAVGWFDRVLQPGVVSNPDNQVWLWHAAGSAASLIGLMVLLLGSFELLLLMPALAAFAVSPDSGLTRRDWRWFLDAILTSWVPVMTFFAFLGLGAAWVPAGPIFHQGITNQIQVWMLLNAAIGLGVGRLLGSDHATTGGRSGLAFISAFASVALCMTVAILVAHGFTVDFRLWVVALKPLNLPRFGLFLVYLPGFTLAFAIILHRLNTGLSIQRDHAVAHYISNIGALAGGLVIFLAVQYGTLLSTGQLLTWTQPANISLAVQLLPVMVAVAVIGTFTWRRTGNALVGGLIAGGMVTWYFVASQATHISW